MDYEKIKESLTNLSEDEQKQALQRMDQELDKYIDNLESSSSKYVDGWSEDNWEIEMEDHPFFAGQVKENQELTPLMQGIQDIKYSADENTPEELAKNYKEDGNFNFKCKKYKFATAAYSEGIKLKCSDTSLNTVLFTNRAAAQFYLGNYRSSLLDCLCALKLSPDHFKAQSRAAQNSYKLKKYEDCIYWCEKILESNPKDSEASELRKKSISSKSEAERDRRKKTALLKKAKFQSNLLSETIFSRGIRLHPDSPSEIEELNGTKVKLIDGVLVWPVLFMYPENGQTDFIEEFKETDNFDDHIRLMFGEEPPEWDAVDRQYTPDSIRVYYEVPEENSLKLVDKGRSLLDTLKRKDYLWNGGGPAFLLLPDRSAFFIEFIKKYKNVN